MKVFISWSGKRSQLVALALEQWIKCVLQAAQPWVSQSSIESGALWFPEITSQLQDSSIGIICLTQDNKDKPWILFEAGALAKGLNANRVCTFLIDLEALDVEMPLSQFQATKPTKDSVKRLIATLNLNLESNRLHETVLNQVFDTYWPQFEQKFAQIIKDTNVEGPVAKRNDTDLLAEILSTVRGLSHRISAVESRSPPDGKQLPPALTFPAPDNLKAFINATRRDLAASESEMVKKIVANLERTKYPKSENDS